MTLYWWCKRGLAGLAVVSILLPWLMASDPFITLSFSGLRLALGDSPLFALNPYVRYAPIVFLGPIAGVLILWRSFKPMTAGPDRFDPWITLLLAGVGLVPILWLIVAMLSEASRLMIFGQALALGSGPYLSVGAFGAILAMEVIAVLARRRGHLVAPAIASRR